ncbi:hypothetical protein GCM10007862_16560 [Dyella lipolytica]|uniref:Glycine-rich protein n=1 Tax=Dyella lipolytica TaxID=1867835 RepID=A0ABW8IT38_9GAMM|nr:hypothetical protein [Dyella lipolytica]GLQ46605.1 hypothetical protein GCM10007862_16560 [Dyella lipolytica]
MKYTIKRLLTGLVLAVLMGALSGCYVAPGYSYVQGNGSAGDVYYGSGPAVVYNGYYPYGYGYYPYGYYGYYGCCYAPGVFVGGGWYGGRYWRGNPGWRGGSGWHGHGGWSGGHGASHGSGGHFSGH